MPFSPIRLWNYRNTQDSAIQITNRAVEDREALQEALQTSLSEAFVRVHAFCDRIERTIRDLDDAAIGAFTHEQKDQVITVLQRAFYECFKKIDQGPWAAERCLSCQAMNTGENNENCRAIDRKVMDYAGRICDLERKLTYSLNGLPCFDLPADVQLIFDSEEIYSDSQWVAYRVMRTTNPGLRFDDIFDEQDTLPHNLSFLMAWYPVGSLDWIIFNRLLAELTRVEMWDAIEGQSFLGYYRSRLPGGAAGSVRSQTGAISAHAAIESGDAQCAICEADFSDTQAGEDSALELAVRTRCGHYIGSDCIDA